MTRRLQLFKDKHGAWRFQIVETDGSYTSSSDPYDSKAKARRAAHDEHPHLEITDR